MSHITYFFTRHWFLKSGALQKLKVARFESFFSILIGGLISLSIITAASVNNKDVNGVIDLAKGLEPLYGKFAIYFLGIGLLLQALHPPLQHH